MSANTLFEKFAGRLAPFRYMSPEVTDGGLKSQSRPHCISLFNSRIRRAGVFSWTWPQMAVSLIRLVSGDVGRVLRRLLLLLLVLRLSPQSQARCLSVYASRFLPRTKRRVAVTDSRQVLMNRRERLVVVACAFAGSSYTLWIRMQRIGSLHAITNERCDQC